FDLDGGVCRRSVTFPWRRRKNGVTAIAHSASCSSRASRKRHETWGLGPPRVRLSATHSPLGSHNRAIRTRMAKLLVIEDEPDVRNVMEYNLALAGHEVVSAGDGRQGLRLAREIKPDLVLLDLMLPDLSGTEVCRAL